MKLPTLALLTLTLNACGASSAPPSSATSDVPAGDVPAGDVPAGDVQASDVVAAQDVVTPSMSFTETPLLSEMPVRSFSEPDQVLDPGKDYRAVIETDAGRIVIDLFETRTPLAVNSFIHLALHRYFDGLAFHRVLEGFVAQGGDPLTATDNRARWGTGGPGYNFDTETFDDLVFSAAGTLGMARSASRASNGSQFFITLAPTPNLNGMYTVFGRVTEGLDVLPRIARNATQTTPPSTPTRMTRVRVEERPRGGA